MKRILFIILLCFAGISAFAQEGLYIEDLFEGRVIPLKHMKRSFISGSELHPYGLDTYKSLKFSVDEGDFHTVEVLVMKDANESTDKQTIFTGDHLTYAVICFPPTLTGLNRFLCFQAVEKKGKWDVTVVYLRGTATVEDLDAMFNKKRK